MNDENNNLIAIKILDRTYQIKCTPSEAQDLQESAKIVDAQMRKARQTGTTGGLERIAILVALNLCQEVLHLKRQQNLAIDSMNERIQSLHDRVKSFLSEEETVSA